MSQWKRNRCAKDRKENFQARSIDNPKRKSRTAFDLPSLITGIRGQAVMGDGSGSTEL
jgi:hypothetical protein